jgi:hypothetical protein
MMDTQSMMGDLHRLTARLAKFFVGGLDPCTDGRRKNPIPPKDIVRQPAIVMASKKLFYVRDDLESAT